MIHRNVQLTFLCALLYISSPLVSATVASGSGNDGMGHIHLMLITDDALKARKQNFTSLITAVADDEFLRSPGRQSDNALAPCAVVAAGLLSVKLNYLWWKITMEKKLPKPPVGTNIFGMYDDLLTGDSISDIPPDAKADILARLFIWHSWGETTTANTHIRNLSQQQCLNQLLMTKPESFSEVFQVDVDDLVLEHSTPVSIYSTTYSRSESERFLSELDVVGMTKTSPTDTTNPLMPCSLLRAFRLSSRVNARWQTVLNGKLPPPKPNMPIAKYSDLLQDGRIPTVNPPIAAEIAAFYFGLAMITSDIFTDALISRSSQRECLEEIFEPGTIRSRLRREKEAGDDE